MSPVSNLIPEEANPVVQEDIQHIANTALPWDKLRDKTVLVSGGGGFLAAYLIKAILAASRLNGLNTQIICLARSQKSVHDRLLAYLDAPDFFLVKHDISQPLPVDVPRADFVIHAASQASPKYYGIDPVGTLLANSIGTMYLLEYARQHQAERFLFFSSGEVYGAPVNPAQAIGELDYGYLDPMQVRSCYAESKRVGETMCVSWAHQFGLHSSVVRPFHTYGPGMALDDGRVFADFVADVVARRDIVLKSDGLAIRPFCYLTDATIGFLTVLLEGQSGEAYNVGNPDAEISIRDLAYLLADLFPERGVGVQIGSEKFGAGYIQSLVQRAVPDINKLGALGWQPKIGIRDGFLRTIQSFL